MTNGNIDSLAGLGCSDGGCIVYRPTGMHTNGGCRCVKDLSRLGHEGRIIVKALQEYRQRVIALEKQVDNQIKFLAGIDKMVVTECEKLWEALGKPGLSPSAANDKVEQISCWIGEAVKKLATSEERNETI